MGTKTIDVITEEHRQILLPREINVLGSHDIPFAIGRIAVPSLGECIWVNEMYHSDISQATGYEAIPDKVIERRRSAHEVGFGRLTKRNPNKANGQQHLLTVAVKPFNDHQAALNEVHGYLSLEDIGVETYSPVGIFPTKAGGVAVVTKKRDDLVGLDRDTWIVGRKVESEEDVATAERNTRTVQDIARMFAWLHANSIFHPDGQLKNWGVTPDGTIGTFDTERYIRLQIGDSDAFSYAWNDIDKFLASIIVNSKEGSIFGVGMLHGMPRNQMNQAVEELFMEPYVDALYEIGITHAELSRQAECLLDSVSRRFKVAMRDENWPSVYDN